MSSRNGVGAALRTARVARQMSLSDVAGQAGVSAATLSRIETDKQSVNVALLLQLTAIVGADPRSIIDGDGDGAARPGELARDLATLSAGERAGVISRATKQSRRGRAPREAVMAQIENLLATIDLIVDEIDDLRKQTRRKS